jgi:hypothetical protein
MLNPWLSLSLHTAQLALKMTQIMTGVVPNSTGSSHISESDDRAVPQVRGVTEEQSAVAEVKNRPMVAAAEDNSRRSRTKSAVRKTPSRAKVGHTPKEAAPRRAADVAIVTSFGPGALAGFRVITNGLSADAPVCRETLDFSDAASAMRRTGPRSAPIS